MSFIRTKTFALSLLLTAAPYGIGCGPADEGDGEPTNVPIMPQLRPGEGMLTGQVTDATGRPVSGATIVVAETDATATSTAEGRYAVAVPTESTVTLVARADGFAPTYLESIELPVGKSSSGFDVLMLPPAKIEEYNRMGRPDKPDLGVVAVKVHSLSGRCAMGGAKISVAPTGVGTIFYAASTTGPVGEPDPQLTGVSAQTGVAAWLAGVFPAGSAYALRAEKAGCNSIIGSLETADRIHTGHARVGANALTQLTLFLD